MEATLESLGTAARNSGSKQLREAKEQKKVEIYGNQN